MFLKTRLETGSPVVTEKQIPVRPTHEHVKAPQVGPRGQAKLCHLGVCVCVSPPPVGDLFSGPGPELT